MADDALARQHFCMSNHVWFAGPIPPSLGDLDALQILALEDNELSGGFLLACRGRYMPFANSAEAGRLCADFMGSTGVVC